MVRGKGTEVSFDVTDRKHSVKVVYDGILPDLFRAGQGVVAEGSFSGGGDTFVADTMLAKHDAKYMPREVADELKKNGEWYGDTRTAAKRRPPEIAARRRPGDEWQRGMIIELGHFALILALATALLQATLPLLGARRGDAALMNVAPVAALTVFALIAVSFAVLMSAYVRSDFSVLNVWQNSHSMMPLLYKFTGVWGNHEGSMMLWVLILAFFGALVALFGGNLPETLKANALAVQAWIASAFLALHPRHLEPLRPPRPGAARRAGPQPDPAGFRPRRASADALSRLCRLLHHLLLRHRRADRRPHRRRLGALGAALGARRLVAS